MRIVIATGGTGGHIFPALQTAAVLKQRGHEVFFIGSLGLGEDKVRREGFDATVINAQGLTSRSIVGICRFAFSMLRATVRSLRTLRRIRPVKVVGFGGYGSFAVVLAARLLNIPTMIHEQNVVPGKANRLLARWVRRVAVSFPETQEHLGTAKTVWTGCPCHQQTPAQTRQDLLSKLALDPACRTILVLGGSQGSQKLNEVFFDVMSVWGKQNGFQALHMTGKKEYGLYSKKYHDAGLPVKVFEFIHPIEEAYAAADLVIARSGAATVCEVGFFAIPTIFVPYPLADGHQRYNAEVLAKRGAASIIDQKDLTVQVLIDALKVLNEKAADKKVIKDALKDVLKEAPEQQLASAIEAL